MSITLIVILNLALSLLAILLAFGLVLVSHRLPAASPYEDEGWGRGGNPWVASDPLPVAQVSAHETKLELARAA